MRYYGLALLMTLASCTKQVENATVASEPVVKEVAPPTEDLPQELSVPLLAKAEADTVPTDTAQIVVYDEPGAFTIYPDTAWLNEAQKDEEAYNIGLDDFIWYEYLADSVLRSRGIKILPGGITERRYYQFKLAGGRDFYLDMRKIRGQWGMVLFNGKDIPEFFSPVDIAFDMDSINVFKK